MMSKTSWILLLSGLAGCTVGPDYRKVEPAVPNHWQAGQVPEAGLKPASPESLKNWWKSFGDAQLDKLMDQALAGNLDIKIALARIDHSNSHYGT